MVRVSILFRHYKICLGHVLWTLETVRKLTSHWLSFHITILTTRAFNVHLLKHCTGETIEKIMQIKEKLKTARDPQKSYADKRRKSLEFNVGDRVLLKVSLWKGVVRFELRCVHDTFHVSNLKKCLADSELQVPLEEIKIDDKLYFVEEPVEIMDRDVKKLKRRARRSVQGQVPAPFRLHLVCSRRQLNSGDQSSLREFPDFALNIIKCSWEILVKSPYFALGIDRVSNRLQDLIRGLRIDLLDLAVAIDVVALVDVVVVVGYCCYKGLIDWYNSPLASWYNSPPASWYNSPPAPWYNSPPASWYNSPLAPWYNLPE
ncbi:hypothetical protein Tco_0626090 [Tanacetum coccineum]|uniref:Reverse transcriptase domain-containing protein n=1 Tax=Tanacetum coccineum TaxID=301880 RepID=A0ABQ4WIN1_9ASTR